MTQCPSSAKCCDNQKFSGDRVYVYLLTAFWYEKSSRFQGRIGRQKFELKEKNSLMDES